jgi:GNAT superfamily N-acetyltransferase
MDLTPNPKPIFVQPWWLDAVAPNAWGEIEVERGGHIFAKMPYVRKRRLGQTLLTMPPFTQFLGPWLRDFDGKLASRLTDEKELCDQLISRLPRFSFFRQNFHHSFTNWLPFFWHGFQQTTRYTYVLDDLADLDAVFGGFSKSKRKNIRKAEKAVCVREDLPPDKFYQLHTLSLAKEAKQIGYGFDLFLRLYQASYERAAGKTFFAVDPHGNIHGAVFVVWNELSAYFLISAFDPEYRDSGASSLLIWEAIQYCSARSRVFDFEGSMIEGVERSFRGFGAAQRPYFQVSKCASFPLRVLLDVRAWRQLLAKPGQRSQKRTDATDDN